MRRGEDPFWQDQSREVNSPPLPGRGNEKTSNICWKDGAHNLAERINPVTGQDFEYVQGMSSAGLLARIERYKRNCLPTHRTF